MFTGTGATKSFTSAGNDADERLFRKTLPNALQIPGWKTPSPVRLSAVSPKVSPGSVRGAFGGTGSTTDPAFTAASELALVASTWLPQQGAELALKQTS